jgi:hypothetical protein
MSGGFLFSICLFGFAEESDGQPNGPRFSRREASAASEAVGWKRRLGGRFSIITFYTVFDSTEKGICSFQRKEFLQNDLFA